MRYGKLLLSFLPLLAFAACEDDTGVTDLGDPAPAAAVRFINAGVDAGAVDLTFVDKVENLPTFKGVVFRGSSGLYQRVLSGNRTARVFYSSNRADSAKIRLVDTPITLTTDQRYTLAYTGRVAGDQDRLAVIEEVGRSALPTPAATQIAVQALHLAFGTGNVDVYVVPVAGATTATPANFATSNAGVIRNVAYLGKSAYVTLPKLSSTGNTLYRFVVTAAGSTTPLFAATPNQPGLASTVPTVGPQPGVQIGGSVMTVVVAPGAVAGSRQATSATTTPTVLLLPDKALDP